MDDVDELNYTLTNLTLCIYPTITEGLKFARDLIIANIFMRLIIQCIKPSYYVRHSFSLTIGSLLLYYHIETGFFWNLALVFYSYINLGMVNLIFKKRRGITIAVLIILFLVVSELYYDNPTLFHQIRGVQMIASMKIISLAVDVDQNLFKSLPTPIEFAGYVFCPANCIIGPWISFHTYNRYLEVILLNRNWIKLIIVNLILSMIYLILSTCIIPWYIMDNWHKLLTAYRDAQAFRASHYFISTVSQVSMIAAGFGLNSDCNQEVCVTKPYFIELPRSLVQVVIYWNMPMHQWLKNYVFKVCQRYGQFVAITATYIVSSLLHGANFQLSAVLLSIGTFSYVEYKIRSKISSIFSMCCLVNSCAKNCSHLNKKNCISTQLTNFFFSFLTVVHLAYLGVMFEASFATQESGYSYSHTLSKWENLNYSSHIIVAITYLTHILI